MRLRLERGGGGGGIVGMVVGTLVFLFCAATGAFATWATAADWLRIVASHGWPEVPCEIEASRVVEDPGSAEPYRFAVQYRYRHGGREYRSANVARYYTGSGDVAEAQRLALRYPVGAVVPCIVDPAAPRDAALEHDSLWRIIMVFGTLAFFVVGAVGLWMIWGSILTGEVPEGTGTAARKSRRKRKSVADRVGNAAGGRGCLMGFFSIFLFAGLAIFVPFFGLPMARAVASRAWQPVPCTVESSAVAASSSDDGDTYHVEVLYAYEMGGHALKGSRYSFMTGSTGGYERKAEVVAGLAPGTRTTCWVDPDDPVESVIDRNLSAELLVGLLPLVFVAVGAWGMVFAWHGAGGAVTRTAARSQQGGAAATRRREGRAPRQRGAARSPADGPPPVPGGTARELPSKVVLDRAGGLLGRFAGLLAMALLWNGIVGVFVYIAVESWRSGAGDGCLTLFITPFLLVGLLLLAGLPYQFLALFNPRPKLVLSAPSLPVGGTVLLEWSFRGAAGRLRRLRIGLEGREEIHRRNDRKNTTLQKFAEIPVVDLARPQPLATGHAAIEVPPGTRPSSGGEAGRTVWFLKVHGEIRGWPDVNEEHEVEIT